MGFWELGRATEGRLGVFEGCWFMALVSIQGVSMAFGGPTLLDRVDWQVERGGQVDLDAASSRRLEA
jgi:hypothetical protein